MEKPEVTIASLDLFWMPQLAESLRTEARCALFSTWDPKKASPQCDRVKNAWALHYLLAVYKRFPKLQRSNRTYWRLCEMFDHWLATQVSARPDVLYFLSGTGLNTASRLQKSGTRIVIESGSTHTDFQHQIVWEEYRRNNLEAPLFPQEYRDRVRAEFERFDYIQIPSEFVRQTYLERGIPAAKLIKARYGADPTRFQARTEADISPVFKAICSSGVNIRKGARILVEAWKKLGWKESEAQLHWIGWPGHPEVRHLFQDPIPGLVWHHWMSHDELSKLYRSCDVLLLPSFEEGFARVLVEGAACGLPPIATPNTGVEDFFTPDDPEGWLIPCNSVDALCTALQEARNDRMQTFRIGQRAAAKSRNGYSWESYTDQVRANFRKIAN